MPFAEPQLPPTSRAAPGGPSSSNCDCLRHTLRKSLLVTSFKALRQGLSSTVAVLDLPRASQFTTSALYFS